MSVLSKIQLGDQGLETVSLGDLGASHDLSRRSQVTYERFYGLQAVTRSQDPLDLMLSRVLGDLIEDLGDDLAACGQLVYCKTQTHNTLQDRNWLRALADRNGLAGWQVLSLSMTSCASALVKLHFASAAGLKDPMIILTGEKAFHPWVSRLPVGLLAEAPAAGAFNMGAASWRISGTKVRHLPRFYQNPNVMTAQDRRLLQATYCDELIRFMAQSLDEYGADLSDTVMFVPHNLNRPVTDRLIEHFGWQDRFFQGDLQRTGHAYCSDPFLNLRALEDSALSPTQVLILAAGTGVTFATCLLDRVLPA